MVRFALHKLALVPMLALICSCGVDRRLSRTGAAGGTQICTLNLVQGLSVKAALPVGVANGNAFAAGVTVSLNGGGESESLSMNFDATTQQLAAGGAWEKQGTFTLTVSAPGFQSLVLPNFQLTGDGCHVTPVSLSVQFAGNRILKL